MEKKIKVMIVDDSASVRKVIGEIIDSTPDMELMAAAHDPIIAMHHLKNQWPDVMILDIEMPRKDGITFLKEIMRDRPTPVIICSTLAEKDAEITMEALSSGAVEVITKPKVGIKDFLNESIVTITDAVRSAYNAKVSRLTLKSSQKLSAPPKLTADVILSPRAEKSVVTSKEKFVAIGASAGGTNAIENVLKALPSSSPGIVIVQHMPEKFTNAFAQRLDRLCDIEVKEAKDGDEVRNGCAIIAPGNRHMLISIKGKNLYVQIKDGPRVSRHRPSVDVLFRSVSKVAGKNALGIIMTGMGDDGAAGMMEMHNAGIKTIAQDEETCVVFGMPHEAIKLGGVDEILPLNKMADAIISYCN
ncbi:MAG: chemotaxis response regulator protein-glutamate methylesterase [Spirochaetota bacterium]|nr:chemotaxis response regulator protein-glutamate methylesterase [Spirochaetota bacterium]